MKKKILAPLVSLLITTNAFAGNNINVECQIQGEPNSSTLGIEYDGDTPVQIFFRSPESDIDRPQNMLIETVDQNSFTAKPKLEKPIQWEQEPLCFKEIGTQLYFILNFKTNIFGVYLAPYFARKDQSCIPPRVRPQSKPLNCIKNS